MFKVSITIVALLANAHCASAGPAFAVSSSNSPKKTKSSNQGKAAGGFGKTATPAPVVHDPDTSDSTQDLIKFLVSQKSRGIGTEDCGNEIGFHRETGIRGLYATKNFKKGEIICRIPSDCALALSDPQMGGDDVPTIAHGGRNYILLYQDDAKACKLWAPYLNTLPTEEANFDATPDYYSDEEVEALEFPRFVESAKTRKQQIQDLAEKEGMTFSDLQFATWLVSSRSFQISISNEPEAAGAGSVASVQKSIRVLLPYLDMINHNSNEANAELHLIDPEKDEAWFAIRATRPIKAGKEVTIAYGTGVDSSFDLLLNYGFVPDDNKIDAMVVKKGGEGSIESLEGWSTTLEEDEKALEGEITGNMGNVLKFRTVMKRSYP